LFLPLNLGASRLSCTIQDSNGFTANCNTTVTVYDRESPRVTCPAAQQLVASAGGRTAVYNWFRTVSAVDNVGVNRTNCTGGPSNNIFNFGSTTTITCNAWDTAGNTASCSYVITMIDTTPPNITCPGNLLSNTSTNLNTAPVTWQLTAADNVGIAAGTLVCNYANGTLFGIGTVLVTCTVLDTSSLAQTCTFNVTVTDKQAPVLTCPSSVSLVSSATGPASDPVPLNISAIDNSLQPFSTFSCLPFGYPTTASFPLGLTAVSCTAIDPYANRAVCNFSVLVLDRTAPTLTCLALVLNTLPGLNYSLGNYSVATSDNVNVTRTTCTPANNGTTRFLYGSTNVTCSAYDAAGNNASCSFAVTVLDLEFPVVSCPPSVSLSIPFGQTAYVTVNLTSPNATDNVGLLYTNLSVSLSGVTTSLSPTRRNYTFASVPSSVTLTFRATDLSSQTSPCSWGVTVYPAGQPPDTVPPMVNNCPTPFMFYTTPSSSYSSTMYNSSVATITVNTLLGQRYGLVTWPALNATDDRGYVVASYLDWSPNAVGASTAGLAAGTYIVAYQATDLIGNQAYCVFKVVVIDAEAPVWANCPGNTTYVTNNNPGAVPSWPNGGILATDNFNIPYPYGTCVSSPPGLCPTGGKPLNTMLLLGASGSGLGAYSFVYTAVDYYNNVAKPCVFGFTIVDNLPPTLIGCSTNLILATTALGKNTADISNLCPVITATDNVAVAGVVYTSTPAGYNCSTAIPITIDQGVLITVTAYDEAGLSSFCSLIVTVSDKEPPFLLGCNPNADTIITTQCDPGLPTATINFPTITATDNSGSVTLSYASLPSGLGNGSAFPLGASTITVTATDSSFNSASCTLRVFVADTQPPVIRGFPSSTSTSYTYRKDTDLNSAFATVVLPNITVTDNVALGSYGYQPSTYASNQPFPFPVGQTQVVYTAADTSLNLASVTLVFGVVDNQPPVISGCVSVGSTISTLFANTTVGLPNFPVVWPAVTASDNVDGPRVAMSLVSQPSGFTVGSLFRVGTTLMTYTAVDTAGNPSTCTFLIEVDDYEPPRLICPGDVSGVLLAGTTISAVNWRDPVITDNNVVANVNLTHYPGMNFSLGITNVTYGAVDPSGNYASCTFCITLSEAALTVTTSSSSSSIGAVGAGAGGGGVFLLLIIALVLFVVMRRNAKKKLQAAASGYAELMAMSDEFILERARAIQQTLLEQRGADTDTAVTANAIHPDRKFAPPPTTLAELEEYMRTTVNKEIPRESLQFGPELGSGEFGAVYEGSYKDYWNEKEADGEVEEQKVAIKMLRKATSDEDKVRFLKEAAIMAQFNHPNIVGLTGVCTQPSSEPTLIVLPYMHLGSLQGYLQNALVKDQLETLTMVRMALDVSAGMQYLAEAGFVHRDLAARNVLLDKNMVCHVGDFGLSVDLASGDDGEDGVYSGSEDAKIPIRWTAIEAFCFHQFSSASDVWSFGVLLWELWTYAELPYKGWNNKKVTEQVSAGFRLPKPDGCPDEVYKIMIECWNKNVKRRVTFAKINASLVQAWKDIARDALGGDTGNDNLYDAGDDGQTGANDSDSRKGGIGMALYDTGDDNDGVVSSPKPKPKPASGMAIYDAGDDNDDHVAAAPVNLKSAVKPKPAGMAVYDTGDDYQTDLPKPAPTNPAQFPVAAVTAAVVATASPQQPPAGLADDININHVGLRVTVQKFGVGTLRFFGPHHRDGKNRCGVELDEAIGINNGTMGEHFYFQCEAKHGVLVDPRIVTLMPHSTVGSDNGYLAVVADD